MQRLHFRATQAEQPAKSIILVFFPGVSKFFRVQYTHDGESSCVTKITASSSESYYSALPQHARNQNLHAGHFVEHRRLSTREVA
jgi:hypothetical protein